MLADLNYKIKNVWQRFYLLGINYDKLHLGSGAVILPGWLNIDFDTTLAKDIYPLDLRDKLPFPDSSVSIIFSEHTIEHLSKLQGLAFLKECYRVLKPGGKIRFGWPDFSKHIAAYIKKDPKYKKGMQKHMGLNLTESWDEFISDLLYSWDHRYMYTPKLLADYFQLAGFKHIKIKTFNESDYDFIWDTRNDPDTTYIESIK